MKIKKIDGDILPIINRISTPEIIFPDEPSFFRWDRKHELSEEEVVKRLQLMPWLLLELLRHVFNYNNFGEDNPFCTTMHFNSKEFESQKDFLPQIFGHAEAFPVRISSQKEEMWQVQVERISPFGLQIVEKMRREELLPPELTRLYIDTECVSDCQNVSFYSVIDDEMTELGYEPSAFVKTLFENIFLKSIDISSMTLRQCTESDLIRYVVSRKKEVYICVDNCSEYEGMFQKGLCWV